MAKDSDSFNRWEVGTEARDRPSGAHDATTRAHGKTPKADQLFVEAFGELLRDARKDPAFTAMAIQLPSEMELAQVIEDADPDAIHAARETLRKALANAHDGALRETLSSAEEQRALFAGRGLGRSRGRCATCACAI